MSNAGAVNTGPGLGAVRQPVERLWPSTVVGMELEVMCADVGSVKAKRFGWARLSPGGRVEPHPEGAEITALGDTLCGVLEAGKPTALGFECPLFVPVPDDELSLGMARKGDGNRSWSASGGASVMATGLVEMAWILRLVAERCSGIPFHTDWQAFEATGGLFVWEAFVTAGAKGTTHEDDAAIAVRAFGDALPDPTTHNAVNCENPLSLVSAAALWAGLASGTGELRKPVLTIKAIASQ